MSVAKIMDHVVERLNWYEDAVLRGVRVGHECEGCELVDDDCSRCPFACYTGNINRWPKCRKIGWTPDYIFGGIVAVAPKTASGRSAKVDHYKALRRSCAKWARKHGYELSLIRISKKEYEQFIKGE